MRLKASCPLLPIAATLMLVPVVMSQPNVNGQWSTASYNMPINPIHVVLLYNGKPAALRRSMYFLSLFVLAAVLPWWNRYVGVTNDA